jgi:DNA-binding NarL/FixJ family response regulator
LKILVVDDHALVREGLCQVLKGLDEGVTVIQAGDCSQAFALAEAHADLDLVMLDYHLPDMNGLTALSVFGKNHPELPIIMLSGSTGTHRVRQFLSAGAAGFVTKSSHSDELLKAVRQVLEGDVYLPPDFENHANIVEPEKPDAGQLLTKKQHLVLRGIVDGLSNREIAESMHVSEETIKSHVTAILRHFEVQNRTQAVVAAAKSGYFSTSQ